MVALIMCITSVGTLYLKNKRELNGYKDQIAKLESQRESLYAEMNQYQSPTERIMALKATIEFINRNLETPGSSWVEFLYAFEATVPDKVVIKDINPKDFSGTVRDFTVEGEAASIYDILDFISRLQKSGSFEKVFLKQNAVAEIEKEQVMKFSLAFSFKGKKN